MNKLLKSRIEAIQKIAVAYFEAGDKMSSASKGSEREIFIKEILSKIFPNAYRFSTGDIIDRKNKKSGQVDIALEFLHEPSFPMPSTEERLILAESVIVAIEVKSRYNTQWNEFITKTENINNLKRNIAWSMIDDSLGSDNFNLDHLKVIEKVPCIGVFYKGPAKLATLKKRYLKLAPSSKPAAILTLDKGHFIFGDIELTGAEGIFGLLTLISKLATFIKLSSPSLEAYLNA